MYDKYEVMEVTLSGHWYEIVKGPRLSVDGVFMITMPP